MKHSLFELFKIGIGPSSSHTMGPMRAALRFAGELESAGLTFQTASILVDLYGSLALTGHGHGTDRAILLGLSGETPEGTDPAEIEAKLSAIRTARTLELPGHRTINFEEAKHLLFHRDQMYPVAGVASHPNGMRFSAFDRDGALLLERIFFSIGGGFIVSAGEFAAAQGAQAAMDNEARGVPYPFHSAQELLERAAAGNITSDNVGPQHLYNIKRLAYVVRTPAEAFQSPVDTGRVIAGDRGGLAAEVVDKFLARRGQAPPASAPPLAALALAPACGCAEPPAAPAPAREAPAAPAPAIVDFVCEDDVRNAIKHSRKIYIGPRTIVTPSARDLASPSDILVLAQG